MNYILQTLALAWSCWKDVVTKGAVDGCSNYMFHADGLILASACTTYFLKYLALSNCKTATTFKLRQPVQGKILMKTPAETSGFSNAWRMGPLRCGSVTVQTGTVVMSVSVTFFCQDSSVCFAKCMFCSKAGVFWHVSTCCVFVNV